MNTPPSFIESAFADPASLAAAARLRVEDAQGAPPTLPFWLGEAPGRSDELSFSVSRLRQAVSDRLEEGVEETRRWLSEALGLDAESARHLVSDNQAAKGGRHDEIGLSASGSGRHGLREIASQLPSIVRVSQNFRALQIFTAMQTTG